MVIVPSFQHQDSFWLYNDSDNLNEHDAELFRDGSSIMDCSNSEPNLSQDDTLSSESEPHESISYNAKLTPTREVEQAKVDKRTDAVIKDEVVISNFIVTTLDDESSAQAKLKGEANAVVKHFKAARQSSPSQRRKHGSSHQGYKF